MSAVHYTYRAEWSPDDDEYVGLVAEFPSLSWLAPNAAEAIMGIEKLVAEVIDDMTASGEPIPVPLTERRYSGKIALRTSPDLHRRLTVEAAEQGVSVNQWISQKLAAAPAPPPVLAPSAISRIRQLALQKTEERISALMRELAITNRGSRDQTIEQVQAESLWLLFVLSSTLEVLRDGDMKLDWPDAALKFERIPSKGDE
jgi:predicted HicB family RNase H-like nuclease